MGLYINGILQVAKERVHVLTPQSWGLAVGTDFWMPVATGDLFASPIALDTYGWTTTSLQVVTGTAADFLSSSDYGVPGNILLNQAGALLQTPYVFGDYLHGYAASVLLGYMPTKLNLEFWAAFNTVSNNEVATGFGWVQPGGSANVANDHMAMIVSDGTNFLLRSDAASDTGAAVDTSWHRWKIVVTFGGSVEWFIDTVSQGTLAIQTDEWPAAFGAGILATTGANRLALGLTHISYE